MGSTKTSLPSSKKRLPSSPSRTSSKPRTSKRRARRARSPFEPYIRIFYSVHITVLLSCWLQQLTQHIFTFNQQQQQQKGPNVIRQNTWNILGVQKPSPKKK